ncbi:MAG: hypothetical protein AAF467_04960 [Actinomycetota bacterium]
MTEIPEHLLKRSKAAKAGKSGDDAGDSDAAPVAAGSAAPAAAAAAPPAIPTESLPNLDPEPEPAKPEPHYVTAAKARGKIPVWALPIVFFLPFWAYSYAGTLQQQEVADPLIVESAALYTSSGCAGCHGGGGGGGTGYQLSDGEVLATFPEPIDMMVHVARGSAAIAGETYGGERQRVSGELGNMPAQVDAISLVELEMVIYHERVVLSGEDTDQPGYIEWEDHMREVYEAGVRDPIDLDLLLACADPAVTPGATGTGSPDPEATPCPGPNADAEEALAE